jgi:hypothetical protein
LNDGFAKLEKTFMEGLFEILLVWVTWHSQKSVDKK